MTVSSDIVTVVSDTVTVSSDTNSVFSVTIAMSSDTAAVFTFHRSCWQLGRPARGGDRTGTTSEFLSTYCRGMRGAKKRSGKIAGAAGNDGIVTLNPS